MLKAVQEIQNVAEVAKRQGTTMLRKLILYWITMVLAAFAALLLVLSFSGVFSNFAQKFSDTLEIQQRNTVCALSGQINELTAQCVALSETASKSISSTLTDHGATFDDLNDNPTLIGEVEKHLYGAVYSTLCSSDCSGVFILLDATANTHLPNFSESRAGLYLRYSDLNRIGSANQHLIYLRGVSEVARQQQVQMHNRWNLEFDTAFLPGYAEFMAAPVKRLAEGSVWSERIHLRDTWEDVLLLYVPIVDADGIVRGLCGAEISELYFSFSYPSIFSNYGGMTTILAPIDGDRLLLDKAMLGDSGDVRMEAKETLKIKQGSFYNSYFSETEAYLGLQQAMPCKSVSGMTLAAVTLIPESSCNRFASADRRTWVLGSLGFLLCMLALALYLSHRFVRPIARSIQAIQADPSKGQRSGISEIDELMTFIQTKAAEQELNHDGLPPNIEELLQNFEAKVKLLTPTEHVVLQAFVDGYTIEEIAEKCFISIGTAKRHNTNVNRKLGVSSRNELMVYVDLFRRCNRIDEIEYGK